MLLNDKYIAKLLGITSNDKISQQQPSTVVPQSARQRLAKLTATLIGTINAESTDATSPSESYGIFFVVTFFFCLKIMEVYINF